MNGKADVPDDGDADIAEGDVFKGAENTFILFANACSVKNKIERAERLRERLKSAPPAKCGKLTEKLVRLLQEISGE